MLEEEGQFALVDIGVVVLIECLEGLSNGLPLLSDLQDEFLQHVAAGDHCICYDLLIMAFAALLLLQMSLLLGVTLRIVPEDETRQVVNLITHPSAEIGIVDLAAAIPPRVDTLHDLYQVGVLDLDVEAVDGDDVVRLDPAIVILVQRKERLVDRCEVV